MSNIGRFIKNVVLPVGVFAVAAFCTTKAIAKVNETKGTSETTNESDTEEKTVEVAEVVEVVKETVKENKLPIIVAGVGAVAVYAVYKYFFSPEATQRSFERYCIKHKDELDAMEASVKEYGALMYLLGFMAASDTSSPIEVDSI